YKLQLSRLADFSVLLIDTSTGLSRSFTPALTPAGGGTDEFYWRVAAFDAIGNSTFSDEENFVRLDLIPPSKPALVQPAANAVVTTGDNLFEWTASTDTLSGLAGYRIQFALDPLFSNLAVDSDIGASTTDFRTLATDAVYYWRVLASDVAGATIASDSRILTIAGSGPSAPVLLAPAAAHETNAASIAFSWNGSTDSFSTITEYRLQVDQWGDFFAPLVDSSVGLALSGSATLDANAGYYWRVVAVNAASLSTPSDSRFISVDTENIVWLFSPPDGVTTTDSRPVFVWTSNAAVPTRDTFTFQLATETSGPTYVINAPQNTLSHRPATPLAGGQYYWRVGSIDAATNAFTTEWQTITIDTGGGAGDTIPPAAFSLTSPVHNTFTNVETITFRWALSSDTQSGIAAYQFQIDDDPGFGSALYDSTVGPLADSFDAILPADIPHFWRVIAVDAASNIRLSLTTRTVTVDTEAPTTPDPLIRPFSGEDTSTAAVIFRFTAAADGLSGVRRYRVQADTNGSFAAPPKDAYGFGTVITVSGFSQGTWYWRVIAEDTAGNTATSAVDTFRILSTPLGVPATASPINGQYVSDTTLNFDWSDVAAGAVPLRRYLFRASTDSTFATTIFSSQTSDTTSSIQVAGFTAGTWYWRVASEDTLGNTSNFSGVANFRVETSVPPAPSITTPANNTITRVTPLTITWSDTGSMPASGLGSYHFQIIDLNSVLYLDTTITTSATTQSLSVSGFAETTYSARVRARSNAGTYSSWSQVIAFAFDFTPPNGVPTLVSPLDGENTTVTAPSFKITSVSDTGPAGATCRYRFQASRSESFTVILSSQLLGSSIVFTPTYLFSETGTFYWRIAAVDLVGNQGAFSTAESFARPAPTDAIRPIPPSDLRAVADNSLGITLTWTGSPSQDLDVGGQYNIYWNEGRDSAGADTLFKIVDHVGGDTYTYSTLDDTTLVNGTFYRFKVRTQDGMGNEDNNDATVGATARSSSATMGYAVIFNPEAGRRVQRTGGVQIQARLEGAFRNLAETITFQFRPEGGGIWWPMKAASNAASRNPDRIGDESKTVYGMHWDAIGDTTSADSIYDIRALITDRSGNTSALLTPVNLIELKANASDADQASNSDTSSANLQRNMDSRRRNDLDLQLGDDTRAGIGLPKDSLNPTSDTAQGRCSATIRAARRSNTGSGTAFRGLAVGSTEQDEIDAAIGRDTAIGVALSISLPGGQTTLLNGKSATITLSYPRLNDSGFIPGTSLRPESLVVRAASAGDNDSRQLTIIAIDTVNRTITATTTRFSTFLLVAPAAGSGGPGNQANLSRFMVYPNPFRPNAGKTSTGAEYDAANPRTTGIVFDNLPARVRIEVYTLRGERIFDRTTAVNDGYVTWNVRNSGSGEKVASGYYIYVVTDLASGSRVTGKLAVIR
ncbi:MAG: fibronectin type III domain-containing protein, partial [Candidatus Hydrogenedentota bacterium]